MASRYRVGHTTAKVLQHCSGMPISSGYSQCSGPSPGPTTSRCRGIGIVVTMWVPLRQVGKTREKTKPKQITWKRPGTFLRALSSELPGLQEPWEQSHALMVWFCFNLPRGSRLWKECPQSRLFHHLSSGMRTRLLLTKVMFKYCSKKSRGMETISFFLAQLIPHLCDPKLNKLPK